jgi:hypothetical protein
VLSHRTGRGGIAQYLVRWKGLGDEHNAWRDEPCVAEAATAEYWQRQGGRTTPAPRQARPRGQGRGPGRGRAGLGGGGVAQPGRTAGRLPIIRGGECCRRSLNTILPSNTLRM